MEKKTSSRLGEIIDGTSTAFSAQCYQLYEIPELGSLIKTNEGEHELYAVVCQAHTEGLDPTRKPFARGKDSSSEEEIFQSNPQLPKLLRSQFTAIVVGYKKQSHIYQHLPPRPARIHAFVYSCNQQELLEFCKSFEFLSLLMKVDTITPADELIAASIRQMSQAHEDKRTFLVTAGKELAALLGKDYARLKTILERIRP